MNRRLGWQNLTLRVENLFLINKNKEKERQILDISIDNILDENILKITIYAMEVLQANLQHKHDILKGR